MRVTSVSKMDLLMSEVSRMKQAVVPWPMAGLTCTLVGKLLFLYVVVHRFNIFNDGQSDL